MSTPTPDTGPAGEPSAGTARQAADTPSYPAEWALFCDYTTATGQPSLPTTVETLTGFLTALPAAPATVARRVRAVAAAHRREGYLLERPAHHLVVKACSTGSGAIVSGRHGPVGDGCDVGVGTRIDAGRLLAACPTRGWTDGLWGRRDAFLVVLTAYLGYTHDGARATATGDVDFAGRAGDEPVAVIGGHVIPSSDDARTCAACAVVRWLEILGDLDGLGPGSARMTLTAAHAPTARSHRHSPTGAARWRAAAQLLPAIDRHGWHDDYQPMTTRAMRTRLALARARGEANATFVGRPAAPDDETVEAPDARHRIADLADVLDVLDELADDADALSARIKALLEHQ